MQLASFLLASLASVSQAAVIWDGRFNDLQTASDLNDWSWSNQVGPYQYYIHGSGTVDEYIALSADYANPADTSSKQGAKFTLDSRAYWNGQNMRRIELIPQTTAPINQGKVWYHFTISRKEANAPSLFREHQINFFESHFTELKSGWISGEAGTSNPKSWRVTLGHSLFISFVFTPNSKLQWMVSQQSKWSVDEWEAGVFYNFAYEIDFSANTVGLWHSTGGDDLKQVVAPVSASTSSNGADWHLGVLELPRDGYPDANEDFYFSGVYIESGSITTSVAGPA